MNHSFRRKVIDILFIILVLVAYQFFVHEEEPQTNINTKSVVSSENTEKKEETIIEKVPENDSMILTNFQIYFLDVGQGDAILIQNNGEYALVDAGNNKDGKKLVRYFHNLGIRNFKYVIGTHAHEDHIGGMDNIIKNFTIDHFYMPAVATDFRTFQEVIEELTKKEILWETPNMDDTFTLADAKFTVIWVGDDREDLNKDSIVLRITYKNTSYLLTADIPIEIEELIKNKKIQSDVLKVSHHGSKQSNSELFLKKVNPKYAVISVGKQNDYGYPKPIVLERLQKLGTEIYRTDELGTILISSDGDKIYVKTIKTDTNQE